VRAPVISTLRQLVFPTGLAVLLSGAGLSFAPAAPVREHAAWIVPVLLAASAMAAVRLRTLRAFMALGALGAALAALQFGAAELPRTVLALAAFDLVLVLLADDSYFDWQAVQWWLGLLLVQWTIVIAASRWSPETAAAIETHSLLLGAASMSSLTVFTALGAAVLLLRFCFLGDPISAGLAWAAAALTFGSGVLGIGLGGLALGVAVLERTHWIAYHDELTGLPGRRAFNEALAGLRDQYCIAVVDVDHFKKFNDTFGHDTGDQVLRKVAATLAGARAGTAFRCGGEEFAIVYPGLELAEAAASAEQVRQEIEADSFMVRGPARSQRKRPERRATGRPGRLPAAVEVSVTVSIGLAPSRPAADPDEVVKQADKALYAAKAGGRNRVELAQPPRRRRAGAAATQTAPGS
jgi:diguanylate cyclase (GGDEF)-like protein